MLAQPKSSPGIKALSLRFRECRQESLKICRPLEDEDYSIQSMPDVSPPKWHLAHTTWFFETFILVPYLSDYRLFNSEYHYLFNSYYQSVGRFHPRPERGNLSRPSHHVIKAYRQQVNEAITEVLATCSAQLWPKIAELVEIGIQHEEQHQELLLMDIKYNFFQNPLLPCYQELAEPWKESPSRPLSWLSLDEGIYQIGANSDGFSYDNELGQHRVFIEQVALADRLITNGEYLDFINDGGYKRADLWLAEGWDWVCAENIKHPLYWIKEPSRWQEFTLHGLHELDPGRPVTHLSYYEADAFARWQGCRLPTEFEWEALVKNHQVDGQLWDGVHLHPKAADSLSKQLFGSAWEWTASSYGPYPGFKAKQGALGEYNGKFMVNQYVMRGGSFATSKTHIRASYRNFFPTSSRWMFSGLRLAKEE